jgi:SAM-dependent methyltransferase
MNLRSIVDTSELKRQRYLRLTREVDLRPGDRIIELGCGAGTRSIAAWNHENEIVGIDLVKPAMVGIEQPNFVYRRADAADLSAFADGSFDVALSIGMLEHIVPNDRLALVIREARRVARRYAFVVPHRYAFIEPHYQLPLFPIWPDGLRSRVTGRHRRRRPVIWPTAAEWTTLFGDPSLRILNHWYGPLLLYRILVGGR